MEKINFSKHIKTYDSVANEYKIRLKKARLIKKETTKILLDYLKAGDLVLDLGCAVGYDTKMLSKKCSVVGMDISPEMVKMAKIENSGNKKVKIVLGNFLSTKINKKFNGIFANAFIHLFPTGTDRKVLVKMLKVLSPGGVAYISTTVSKRAKEGWYKKRGYNSKEKRFRKYWTRSALGSLLGEVGFKTIRYFEIDDPFGNRFMNFIVQK